MVAAAAADGATMVVRVAWWLAWAQRRCSDGAVTGTLAGDDGNDKDDECGGGGVGVAVGAFSIPTRGGRRVIEKSV